MDLTLKISGINPESIVDGPGIRLVVFVQGCPHKCKGCHNPKTHSFEGGEYIKLGEIIKMIRENPLITGVSFSGGEPICKAAPLARLARYIKQLGDYDIIIYSGYTLETLQRISQQNSDIFELLKLCDTLIDGPYIESERDLSLTFYGSKNQRVINLREYFN